MNTHHKRKESSILLPEIDEKQIFETERKWDMKLVAFVFVAIITLLYVLAELAIAVWMRSLVLLSDGFHNFSDVISLYIAYWAQKAQKRASSDEMSYGWARTEILGGLTNGCFLLSLCLYVTLEAIPKFIQPEPLRGMENGNGNILFVSIAAIGLGVNTIGTLIFMVTGNSHGHSHGDGNSHGHSHGKKVKKSGHSHLEEDENSHGHSHEDGHAHEKKKKKSHDEHSHSHSHSHSHGKKKHKKKRDMNVHAVFLHYLGDAVSSLLVLIAGILIHFFDGKWVNYVDPVSSIVIVILILWTTIPLVKRCSMILLQSTPTEVNLEGIRKKMLEIEGLQSVHDFHAWQLVDGMIITSVHITVEEGADFNGIINQVKTIFHEVGIHSTAIQPEFVPPNSKENQYCEQPCVVECEEDWCCKKQASQQKLIQQLSLNNLNNQL